MQRRLSQVLMACVVIFAVSAGETVALGAPAYSAMLGSPRLWGGIEIRSLDSLSASAAGGQPAARQAHTSITTAPRTLSQGPQPPDRLLSNETTFTRWAYTEASGPIYAQPRSSSTQVARLHWYTEDGFPEIYLLLRAHWDTNGQEWVKLRIPMRPNGHTGWVRSQNLTASHLTHTEIVVDRERLQMHFLSHGREIWSAPVAVGKPSTPTPAGHFWIRERFKITDPASGYWPYALGTSDYSTLSDWPGGGLVGIHGPYYQPQSIPGRISHGCIRLRTTDDAWIAHHAGLGTPIHVI